ncbi:MAG: plasmid recombination protein [Oscillospiraceae bacterium]|nr:plasmid recombination protein [Oscillospiraceae bacterium]
MPRNDGVDRTLARNRDLSTASVAHAQTHNERDAEVYSNPDIVTASSRFNIHYKKPDGSYQEIFDRLEREKVISTRGLKKDAVHFCELLFDVNSAYFHNHGGYEFAKQFYADAYRAAVGIVGGEEYIVSAVMHADERNAAMSDALGYDVFHYHLHVVYIPVVEKQILWSKRCKDPSLVGTVKETIMQVSRSKKWESKPALDEDGKPILNKKGKLKLIPSYSVLQDQFFEAMRAAGYDDIQRGQRGSTEEHLTITQFKVKAEQERLEETRLERNDLELEIDALSDEKADLERQTQAALDKLNEILPDVEQTERLAQDFSADPEEILPPPKRMESARSYRERIKPIWEKIVGVLRSIFHSYLKLKREVQELRSENHRLWRSNNYLDRRIDALQQDNQELQHDLRETARDLDRAKKVLGEETVDQAIATAVEQETAARKNRRRSQEYSR